MTNKFMLKILFFFLVAASLAAQENWSKYDAGNPVMFRDTVLANLPVDLYALSDPWVIYDNSLYRMWYTCGGLNYPADTLMRARVCYAESIDGIAWKKSEYNPVLDVSYEGSWDSLAVETVSVIIDEDDVPEKRYKMWYAGQYYNEYRYDIGYAYSANGVNWEKHGTPVLTVGEPSSWEGGFIEGPSVIKEENGFKMWYAGYNLITGKVAVGLATSTDGIFWEKYTGNPVLGTGLDAWDSIYVQDPHVTKHNDTYHMWYGGCDRHSNYGQQVGYAFSDDGINWVKSSQNPVLRRGETGAWDANTASFPCVIIDDANRLKMWYTGKDVAPPPESSTAYYWDIGYAEGDILSGFPKTSFQSEEMTVYVYPNPASREAFVTLSEPATEAWQLVISNTKGLVLYTGQISKGDEMYRLDVSVLSAGLYFLQIRTGIGYVFNKKLMIDK